MSDETQKAAEELRNVMLTLQEQGLKMPLNGEAVALIGAHPDLFRDVWAADSIRNAMGV